MKLKAILASALVSVSMTATSAEWTAYTYSSVPTTSAVKGMTRIVDRAASETGSKLKIDLHLGKTYRLNHPILLKRLVTESLTLQPIISLVVAYQSHE